LAVWDEPKELDTENGAVISLYDGIKKILENQNKPKTKPEPKQVKASGRESKDAVHLLKCGRILKVNVERRLVVVTVMKSDGEIRQLRIEASQD
jgi:hypothetical protein